MSTLKIKVRKGDKSIEINFPLSERNQFRLEQGYSAKGVIEALKPIVKQLNEIKDEDLQESND